MRPTFHLPLLVALSVSLLTGCKPSDKEELLFKSDEIGRAHV